METRNYFPLGKAYGEAFCNRTEETQFLVDNIKAGKHSLIVAPRRFGKSSLADKAIQLSGLKAVRLNFNTCSDEEDIEQLIKTGVVNLIGEVFGPVDKLVHSMKNYVHHLTPQVSFVHDLVSLELKSNKRQNYAANVEEALLLLEHLLREKNKKAIILLDEFQAVGQISKGKGVEAAIRNALQETRQLSVIFSGSNRHLLKMMFDDEGRPLYKICRKLYLKKIADKHYEKHINKAAKLSFNNHLPSEVFAKIMELSDRHPYFVNYLCDVIWSACRVTPSIKEVVAAWDRVCEEEFSDANSELAQLSMKQKKVLRYFAKGLENVMSAHALQELRLPISTVGGAVQGLIEKDIIDKEDTHHCLINPVIRRLLKEI